VIAETPRDPIVHPLTGEAIPDDLPTLRALEATVDRFLRRLGVHYGFRASLRERIADLQGPPLLPRPRDRTDKQARVAACPHCGRK
jgi:hypothetical protein